MFFWISFCSNHLKLNMDNTEHNSQFFKQNLPLFLGLTAFFQIRSFQQLKAMAPHSSTVAWKIPWMEEPRRLQSMGSLRVGHE